jgi:hypothetical protein
MPAGHAPSSAPLGGKGELSGLQYLSAKMTLFSFPEDFL